VLALVDHDRVPVALLEEPAILLVLLERVDRDDHAVEVEKRVVVGRDLALHALQAHRVEAHQRDGEARPELLLKLLEHALQRHHQDAAPAPAPDQLREEDSDFDGLAEAHGVGDEEARARLRERLGRGHELVARAVHGAAVADVEALVRGG